MEFRRKLHAGHLEEDLRRKGTSESRRRIFTKKPDRRIKIGGPRITSGRQSAEEEG